LLDLFCGAGGASMGYHRAGFDVTGVDNRPQPRYPFAFVQGDALEYVARHGREFDAIAASPPCQAYTAARVLWNREHPDLAAATRAAIEATGLPAAMENVPGAPLRPDLTLCGTMFGLGIAGRGYLRRHRIFEFVNCAPSLLVAPCHHPPGLRSIGVHGHTGGRSVRSSNHGWSAADWRVAMGIERMTRDELAQAIPPAYTHFIGTALLAHLQHREAA
jgi:DNA (cytosine-5)-methyltransferase 1